jgi:hypothetical protein
MKVIRNLICAGTLVLAVSAFGAKADEHAHAKAKARKGPVQTTANANVNANAHVNRRVSHNNSNNLNANASMRRHRINTEAREHHAAMNTTKVNKTNQKVVNQKVVNRKVVNRTRVRNVKVVNNWKTARFNGANYVVFRNYHRQFHPAWWWHRHYSRVIFIGGGWWAWNDGWWYPAWGYAPGITFAFDGPIYGYNGWSPDRVTIAVQERLRADGYYDGPIDGILGTYTRQAIAAFQEDHGLAVTSAIDEPTLSTLGVA